MLYCPKCKTYIKKIREIYTEPIEEIKKWNGEKYELVESNIMDTEYKQVCYECCTPLVWRKK